MYLAYSVTLVVLLLIMVVLWKEERRFKNDTIRGLASKYWVLRERRRFVRFDDEIKIRYNPVRDSDNSRYTKSSNLSRKGLCLLTYEKLKNKGYLDLELQVPGFSKPARVIGQIMWTKDLRTRDPQGRRLFYTGIKFSKIKPGDEAMLLTHINALKKN